MKKEGRRNISRREEEAGREIGETLLELARDNSFLSMPNVKRDKNAEISFEFHHWSKSIYLEEGRINIRRRYTGGSLRIHVDVNTAEVER